MRASECLCKRDSKRARADIQAAATGPVTDSDSPQNQRFDLIAILSRGRSSSEDLKNGPSLGNDLNSLNSWRERTWDAFAAAVGQPHVWYKEKLRQAIKLASDSSIDGNPIVFGIGLIDGGTTSQWLKNRKDALGGGVNQFADEVGQMLKNPLTTTWHMWKMSPMNPLWPEAQWEFGKSIVKRFEDNWEQGIWRTAIDVLLVRGAIKGVPKQGARAVGEADAAARAVGEGEAPTAMIGDGARGRLKADGLSDKLPPPTQQVAPGNNGRFPAPRTNEIGPGSSHPPRPQHPEAGGVAAEVGDSTLPQVIGSIQRPPKGGGSGTGNTTPGNTAPGGTGTGGGKPSTPSAPIGRSLRSHSEMLGKTEGGPGEWVPSGKRTGGEVYQEQISQVERGLEYRVNGTKFDGYDPRRNTLLDAKDWQSYPPANRDFWHRKTRDGARRQIGAANGTAIEWHFSTEEAAAAVRELFIKEDITGIKIVVTKKAS